jgi:hypothetical protein
MTIIGEVEVRVIPEEKKLWVRCFDCHLYFPIDPGVARWLSERAAKTADGALVARVVVTDRNFLAVDIPNMALAFRLRTYTARTLREKQEQADNTQEHGEVEVSV